MTARELFIGSADGTKHLVVGDTMRVLAKGGDTDGAFEIFSRAGVSVFAADVKGDLSGIGAPGEAKEALVTRAKSMGIDYEPDQFPVILLRKSTFSPILSSTIFLFSLELEKLLSPRLGTGM